jgi:hypothetical protein
MLLASIIAAVDLTSGLESFLAPFFQDLDGSSRVDEVRRIAAIARRIYEPGSPAAQRELDLLLQFHLLGTWLEKVGNLSRAMLAVHGLGDAELRRTAQSIRRLDDPQTAAERAVAAARLIDAAGIRGLAERIGRARREGATLADVAAAGDVPLDIPAWFPEAAIPLLREREARRIAFCRELREEM